MDVWEARFENYQSDLPNNPTGFSHGGMSLRNEIKENRVHRTSYIVNRTLYISHGLLKKDFHRLV